MQIKALEEDGDMWALDSDGKPVKPATVQSYLQRAFKSRLADAERALKVRSHLRNAQTPSFLPRSRGVSSQGSDCTASKHIDTVLKALEMYGLSFCSLGDVLTAGMNTNAGFGKLLWRC